MDIMEEFAYLLRAIEKGADWPKGTLHARAVFLAKTDEPSLDPINYRNLTILSVLYRKYGVVRLRNLRPWIEEWKLDNLYAGIPGLGAEDAWYETAMHAELCKVNGTVITGAAADICKCFDQIQKPILYMILYMSGMPLYIIHAYFRFHDNLYIYNSLANGLGKPYKKICSIPQGCPFSMLFISLLLRPLVLFVEFTCPNVTIRILADDILIIQEGDDISQFKQAYDCVHFFLINMGAKLAPHKSYLFSTAPNLRKWLSQHTWTHIKSKVQVIHSFRDLGAHLNFSRLHVATTLTMRMTDAIATVNRIRWLPHELHQKITFIINGALAKGLYGCEIAPVNEGVLAKLTSAIAKVVGPSSAKACNSIVFGIPPDNKEAEPDANIFMRRCILFRRSIAKKPHLLQVAQQIFDAYAEIDYVGIFHSHDELANLYFGAPAGHEKRNLFKPSVTPQGPIGLLLFSANLYTSAFSREFVLSQHRETSIDIINDPFQFVKPLVRGFIVNSRSRFAAFTRTDLTSELEIDFGTVNRALDKIDKETRPIVTSLVCLATWDHVTLARVDQLEIDQIIKCPHCECTQPDFMHYFRCPAFKDTCLAHFPNFQSLLDLDLPIHFFKGIAHTLPADPSLVFASSTSNTIVTCTQLANATGVELKDNNDTIDSIRAYQSHMANPQWEDTCNLTMNSRQFIGIFRGHFSAPVFSEPLDFCTDGYPSDINVLSDGSLNNPAHHFFGFGGAGVWWPSRILTHILDQRMNLKP